MSFLDPQVVAGIQQKEREERMPFIVPEEFYVDYVPQKDGSLKAVEWVRWIKKGQQNPTAIPMRWRDLERNKADPIYQVLAPYYDNWKKGETAPVIGTPFAAWPGATPQLVKALSPFNIRSVEDLAELADSSLQKTGVPNLRKKQIDARAFLQAQKSTAAVSAEIVILRDKLESRDREIAELRELIEKHVIAQATPQRTAVEQLVKRKPGRPRKIADSPAPEAA